MRQEVRCFLFVICLLLAGRAESADSRPATIKSTSAPGPAYAGYQLSDGGGLTLQIAAGTASCSPAAGRITHYNGGRLEMAANATNYIYLDASANCKPAANTTGFASEGAPIATVFTGPRSITGIQAAPKKSPAIAPAVPGGGGINSLNGLTQNSQYFATGTSGSNFNVSSSGNTHTLNLPDASAAARGIEEDLEQQGPFEKATLKEEAAN